MRVVAGCLLVLVLTGCAVVHPYRRDVQQGNVVTPAMINDLTPGMTKEQILLTLGRPVLHTPFDHDEWHYVYTFQPGYGPMQVKNLTLFFKDAKLTHFVNQYPA